MAAGIFELYSSGKLSSLNGALDADTDTLVMVLLADTYTPAVTHSTYADISADEITDTDYTPQLISAVTFSEASGTVTLDSDDVSFGSNVSITAKYGVIVRRDGASLASADLLLGYVDLDTSGGSVSSTNSEFTVRTPSGIYEAS